MEKGIVLVLIFTVADAEQLKLLRIPRSFKKNICTIESRKVHNSFEMSE